MKVADLQEHLSNLRRLLEVAGTKGNVVSDLDAITDGLRPFREHGLKEFADFLIRAEAYSRGEVPINASKRVGARSSTRQPKGPNVDLIGLASETRQMYEQASSISTTPEMVDALMARLQGLKKAEVQQVAAATEFIAGKNLTKDGIIQAIRKRIIDRKGSFQRAGMIDRPST